MRLTSAALIAVSLVSLFTSKATAQGTQRAQSGDRVRITLVEGRPYEYTGRFEEGLVLSAEGHTMVGVLEDYSGTGIAVQDEFGGRWVFPSATVEKMEVSLEQGNREALGLFSGIVVGGTLGYLFGDDPSEDYPEGGTFTKTNVTAIGGLAGGLIGVVIGRGFMWETWGDVSNPSLRPVIQVPPTGRLGFGLTLSFPAPGGVR